jgi:hypothetical protein
MDGKTVPSIRQLSPLGSFAYKYGLSHDYISPEDMVYHSSTIGDCHCKSPAVLADAED